MYIKYIVTTDRLKTKSEAQNFLKNLGENFAVCKVRYNAKYETGQWTCYITYTDRSEFFRDVLYG